MLGLFQFRQAHSSLPQPRSMVIWAKRRRRALPIALAAVLRHDEQVFQIDPGAAQKGGEVVEEQGETYGDAVLFSQENFGLLLFKNPLSQEVFGGYHIIQHIFINGQLFDEIEDFGNIAFLCVSNRQMIHDRSFQPFCVVCPSVAAGYSSCPKT